MKKEKLSEVQIDQLSFGKRTLIKGVLKHNVNIYNENSLEEKLEYIIPAKLGGKQEDFIFSMIYKGKNIEFEMIDVGLRDDYFIMAYNVFTNVDDDQIHFLYSAKDFSFQEIRYFKEANELERIWI